MAFSNLGVHANDFGERRQNLSAARPERFRIRDAALPGTQNTLQGGERADFASINDSFVAGHGLFMAGSTDPDDPRALGYGPLKLLFRPAFRCDQGFQPAPRAALRRSGSIRAGARAPHGSRCRSFAVDSASPFAPRLDRGDLLARRAQALPLLLPGTPGLIKNSFVFS